MALGLPTCVLIDQTHKWRLDSCLSARHTHAPTWLWDTCLGVGHTMCTRGPSDVCMGVGHPQSTHNAKAALGVSHVCHLRTPGAWVMALAQGS